MEPKNRGLMRLEDDVPFQLGDFWVPVVNFQRSVCPFLQLPARFFHFQKAPCYAPCVGKHRLYSHRIHGTGTGIFTKPFPLVHVATFHLGRPMDFCAIFRGELAGNLSGRRFFQSPRLLQTFAFNFCGKSSESPGFWPTNIPKICDSKISSTCMLEMNDLVSKYITSIMS